MSSTIADVRDDARYAMRQFHRSPGFAIIAVVCLALGIGANTAIFTALNSVLFRGLPGTDADRLVVLSRGGANFSYPDAQDFQARVRSLSALTMSLPMESDLDVDGVSEFVAAEVVAPNYGAVLGVTPIAGRWFTTDAESVAVISHAVWQNRFHGSADVIGKTIRSEAQSYTIVGVVPRTFTGIFAPYRTDIWVPARTRPRLASALADRSRAMVMIFARLGSNTTPAQAASELNGIATQLNAEHGRSTDSQPPILAEPLRGIPNPGGRRLVGASASMLMIVVFIVLLIACVNVGNLLLVRGSVRRRELAVRQALGASRSRLTRQLLTESFVLAISGGATGVILAVWMTRILQGVMPAAGSTFPIEMDLSIDRRVIAFAIVLSLATTLMCGLVPALRGARTTGVAAFNGIIGGSIKRRRPFGLIAQVVLSFVLLLVTGSVIETVRQLQATDPGFAISGRLYAYIFAPSAPSPDAGRQIYDRVLDRLRALPGVRSASQTSVLPLMPSGTDCVSLSGGQPLRASTNAVDIGYFATMGIPVIAGRDFDSIDLPRDSTIILTQSLAMRLWTDASPVGAQVLIGCDKAQAATVIGVVRDSAVRNIGEAPQPRFYRPFAGQYSGGITALVLETGSDPAAMVATVRRTILAMNEDIRVYAVQPLSSYVDQSFTSARWLATTLSGFGLLALTLAAIGLYGVIAYRVSIRTQELGIRVALGASRGDIFRDVVAGGLTVVVVGVLIGEALAIPALRAVASVQPGLRSGLSSAHAAAAVIWLLVALCACYVPARRAAGVDPIAALRE